MVTRWKYFSEEELRCKGTGEVHMDEKFMSKLDELRDKLKQPMTISSGYRSESHNLAIGGRMGLSCAKPSIKLINPSIFAPR